jgi:solute carrier family 25 phosphate transporter 23/24/25/41
MRTRLIAPGGEALGGMLGCFNQMIRREGFFSLYKGLFPALLSMVPSGAVFYGVYDILKSHYLQSPEAQTKLQRQIIEARGEKSSSNMDGGSVSHENENVNITVELGPIRTLLYGAIAGACSEVVTYPLEVIRRQLQLQQSTAKIGCVAAFQMIVERDGFGALFSGVTPSTIQVYFRTLFSLHLCFFCYKSKYLCFIFTSFVLFPLQIKIFVLYFHFICALFSLDVSLGGSLNFLNFDAKVKITKTGIVFCFFPPVILILHKVQHPK